MPVLHRDFETRSALALKKCGAWRYAGDPTTEVLCVAFAVDDGAVQIWLPGQPIPKEFHIAARDPDWLIAAHNDAFESAIEERILGPRYGWPIAPIERHRCTMAAALASALPGSLDGAAAALGLDVRKDVDGHRLMMQMSKPRKPRKGEDPNGIYWLDDAERQHQLQAYCIRDVEVERELSKRVPPLSGSEQALWVLDQIINRRGFCVDVVLAHAARELTRATLVEINDKLAKLTGGRVTSVGQVARIEALVKERGHKIQGLGKRNVAAVLKADPSEEVAQLLRLRQEGGKASANKLVTLLGSAVDGRLHGALRYHGAATGRWSGSGFQPHNLARQQPDDPDAAIAAVLSGDLACVRAIGPPLAVIGSLSRSLICAAPGCELIGGDFSGIEARITAWLAGEQWLLDTYRKYDETGDPQFDPYCITAAKILHRPVTPEQDADRQLGKMTTLAFGFGGGIGAFKRINPDADFTDAQIESFKAQWRNAHPKICQFWRRLHVALIKAVRAKAPATFQNFGAAMRDGNLYLKLPSGRELVYPGAHLAPGAYEDLTIVFKDNAMGGWRDVARSWHGLFVENSVQAIARDLLASAMLKLDAAGYPIVLHVHDEIVCEVHKGAGDLAEFKALATALPPWAAGLPLVAKASRRHRYAEAKAAPAVEHIEKSPPLQPADDGAPIECAAEIAPEVVTMSEFVGMRASGFKTTPSEVWVTTWVPDLYADYALAIEGSEPPPTPLFDLDELNARLQGEGVEPVSTAPPASMLAAALDYAKQGLPTFPMPASGAKKSHKSAAYTNGAAWGATTDPNEVRRDFAKWRNANVGIVTGIASGRFVLDIDTVAGHNVDGEATLKALETEYGALPPTRMAVSPSGSKHYYFQHPGAGIKIPNSIQKLGPGIDVQGDNGIVAMPPSVRPGVGTYRWLNDLPLAPAPQWLLELVQEQARDEKESDGEPQADIERVTEWLDDIPNEDVEWDEWNKIGMAVWRATAGSDEGRAAFDAWSRKSAKKYDADNTRERWEHFFDSPPTRIGAGTLWFLAEMARGGADDVEPDDAAPTPPKGNGSTGAQEQATAAPKTKFDGVPLTIDEWLSRDLPPNDPLIGDIFSTTTRGLLAAPTGIGKTNFGMALWGHAGLGRDFLHWRVLRPCRMLFIDGEMSRRLLRERIEALVQHLGAKPEWALFFNREDIESFAPLNTREGHAAIWKLIAEAERRLGGPLDGINFDNIVSLMVGDMKEEDAWRDTMPLVRALTKRRIGQLWLHHTGHDTSRSYGTKTREWQLDLVMHLTEAKRADTDVSFTVSFPKARERTPSNREDFAEVNIALVDNQWIGETQSRRKEKVSPLALKFFEALQAAISDSTVGQVGAYPAASLDEWRTECVAQGLIDQTLKPHSARTLFAKHRLTLLAANWIGVNADAAWILP